VPPETKLGPAYYPVDGDRLVPRLEVLDRVGRSYVWILTRIKKGMFPPGRLIDGEVNWLDSELNAWMKALPQQRPKGDWGYRRGRQRPVAGEGAPCA
jgi:predicted DNA-binding transcriptional regulator AlpA